MIDKNALINPSEKTSRIFAIGTVAGVYSDGLTIRLDGDAAPSQKHYKRLASYTSPEVNHRVLIVYIGGSMVVLGYIV
jgi:hypothetical protein